MKHLATFAAAAISLGLWSCSSDEPNNGNSTIAEGDLYATVRLQFPSTRSETTDWNGNTNSNDGYEVGFDYENNVNNIAVVLATKEGNSYKIATVGKNITDAVPNTDKPTFSVTFQQDELLNYATKQLYVFTICNYEGAIDDSKLAAGADVAELIETVDATANPVIWKNGSFLMTNAANVFYNNDPSDANKVESVPATTLPEKEALQTNYNTPEKAFDLGTVEVTRVCSRFDFKGKGEGENKDTYKIYKTGAEKTDENYIASVKVLAMAPVNVAQEYYLFPRVSMDGTNTNWAICGRETINNWVVSPNFAEKVSDLNSILDKYTWSSTVTDYNDPQWVWTNLSALNVDDNDSQWNGTNLDAAQKADYKVWRYVTENTLPSATSQLKGASTGVLFKAQITDAKEGSIMAEAMAAKKAIYSRNGVIYGDIAALRSTCASLDAGNSLRQAFVKVFGEDYLKFKTDDEGNVVVVDKKKVFEIADADLVDATADTNNGTFKIYRPENDGNYYVYYLYRNRHNDNDNPAVMGAMEFGTVRNNIYKLAIETINEFGHTTNPGDDPDPEEPGDPDEDPKTYFKVSCRVLPWMVRVNNLDF